MSGSRCKERAKSARAARFGNTTKPHRDAAEYAPMSAKEAQSEPVGVRERIIAAAVQLLHEQGINALTQTKVSHLAGVRQSHLTYYFPTRTDLLKQAVLSGVASLQAALDGPAESSARSLEEFRDVFEAHCARVTTMLGELLAEFGGTISAEHGVGLLKKPHLLSTRSPAEIELMRRMKNAFDPAGILNPGKIFDEVPTSRA